MRAKREDIVEIYRRYLGREPESEDVVGQWLVQGLTPAKLEAVFAQSDEHRRRTNDAAQAAAAQAAQAAAQAAQATPSGAPLHVDLDVGADNLARMLRRIEGEWEAVGASEPHWSVIARDDFRQENIGANERAFHDSGRFDLEVMERAAARSGVDLGSLETCLELGCGVGRVTLWLAQRFKRVIACDISEPHLALAREAARREGRKNIDFRALKTMADLAALPPIDAMFSVIVLQHNPPPVIAFILQTLLSKLKPSGIAFFQVPTYADGYRFSAVEYLKGEAPEHWEMHIIPQPALFNLVSDANCDLLEVREVNRTGGSQLISNDLLVRKRKRPVGGKR